MTPSIKKAKGPFTLLAVTLIVSELLLGIWILSAATDSDERIVAGSMSVAVLIAFLGLNFLKLNVRYKQTNAFETFRIISTWN